jgi:hypothetical protein
MDHLIYFTKKDPAQQTTPSKTESLSPHRALDRKLIHADYCVVVSDAFVEAENAPYNHTVKPGFQTKSSICGSFTEGKPF